MVMIKEVIKDHAQWRMHDVITASTQSDSERMQPDNRHMNCDAGRSTDDITKNVNDQQMNRSGLKDDQHNVIS